MVRAKGRRLGQDHSHEGPGDGGNQLNPSDITLKGVQIDADSVDISDDQKLFLGDNDDVSLTYNPTSNSLVVRDETNGEVRMEVNLGGVLEILNRAMSLGDQKLFLGTNDEWSVSYDSTNSRLTIRDEANAEDKIYLPDNGDIRVVDRAVVEGELEIDNTTGSIQLPNSFN